MATMKVGERAVFTISSDYGYGDEGSEPVIPGGATLVFEVMPDDEMIIRSAAQDRFHRINTMRQRPALFMRRIGQSKRRVTNEFVLPVSVGATVEQFCFDLVIDHIERREIIAIIRKSKVGWSLQEDRP